MARIPDEQIERIKREVSLADLCREYGIELRGSGKNLMAKSPFREEEEASFVVTPGKNLWNDLGAEGEGGDNIQLVMRMEKISFRRAAEKLLARLGAAPEAGKVTTRFGTAHEILADPDEGLNDIELMRHVVGFYHTTFCNQPQAMQYLQKRKCFHPEAVKLFQSGHEHLNGSVVFPLFDRHGTPVQIYGRKITTGLRKGTPDHLYLPAPKRGIFNGEALAHQREWIVCESILDALTLWVHGFRNVTCTFGAGDFNEDLWSLVHDVRPGRIVCCQDNACLGSVKLSLPPAVSG